MIPRPILAALLLPLACAPTASRPSAATSPPVPARYPPARVSEHADVYHGTRVADPYRWLEDTDSPETRAWIEAENELTRGFLERVDSRPGIRARLEELWNHERYGIPVVRGGRYFFLRNDGLQNQSVLHVMDSAGGEPRVLLDPNLLSPDGTVALSGFTPTDDGRLLAYGLAERGSDWEEWRVRDVATGADLPDHVRWVKFSAASWTRDGKGFFYSRYAEPRAEGRLEDVNYHQKLYHHRLGTPQSGDTLVYERPDDKELGFNGRVTDDGRRLVIMIRKGTDPRRRIAIKDLEAADGKVTDLVSEFEAAYDFAGSDGDVLWFRTDLDAPRGRVVAFDLAAPAGSAPRKALGEAGDTLTDASVVGGVIIASYLQDASTRVKLFRLDGTLLRDLALPGIGTAAGFEGRTDDTETFFSFATFTEPAAIHRLDLRTGEASVFRKAALRFDPAAFETRQVFCRSADGTRVPIFISSRKGIARDGSSPTVLHGYGGFDIPLTPAFSPANLLWMEMGGIFAVANLRGGGEYGKEWHEAGMKERKQNVFDDFIAAATWLVSERYTSRSKLAIWGRSNGGLLVGASITQRPELFGAAIADVGVHDMLRFHKFTIGWAWVPEFGSADDPEEFRTLIEYSPLHNLKAGTAYPPTLITTADHDDRVVPAHSFKFAAALQAAQGGPAPILIRIDTKSGHGSGKPTAKLIEEAADRLAFLAEVLGVRWD
jgi:prolyl oligopeptidase